LSVNHKQDFEVGLVQRLLATVGITPDVPPEQADRPDVIVHIGGQWIGIEVTVLHPDDRSSGAGSKLRQQEELLEREGQLYGMFIDPDPADALAVRIAEKLRASAGYNIPTDGKLWLYVACAVPGVGQTASTHVLPGRLGRLLSETESCLAGSRFARVFVYAIMREELWEWTPTAGWRGSCSQSAAVAEGTGAWDFLAGYEDDEFIQKMIESRGEDDDALNAEIQRILAEDRSKQAAG